MRAAGAINAATFERLAEAIKPGVTTAELDDIAARFIRQNNAICSFWHYNGYPGHICTSVNGQVVHGIPSKKVELREGDCPSGPFSGLHKSFLPLHGSRFQLRC